MCSATALAFSVSAEISNREDGGFHSKENRNVAAAKTFAAELSDQRSGRFSKYWRVLTEFSKLPFVRDAGVHRKQFSSQSTRCSQVTMWSMRIHRNQKRGMLRV